jgi:CheY-like chemotaxis protein
LTTTDRIQVLLADDDPVVRAGYAKKVRDHGWQLTLAADGFEAMQAVRNGSFDVLLLDLKMPYRNGADVLRILRQERSLQETRVFLLAEPGDGDLVEQAMREGADGVFDKAQMAARDVISELQVMFHGVGRARRGGTPQENVPDDVQRMASRFRKGGGRTSGGGNSMSRAAMSQGDLGRSQAPAPVDHPPQPQHPRGAPKVGPGGSPMGPSRSAAQPPRGGRGGGRPPVGNQSAQGYGAPPQHPYDPPPQAYESYPDAEMVPQQGIPDPPGPPTAEPLPGDVCFDTVLNKMVGEASRLAQYLGLPHDFSCPVCRNTLILRLWPEPGQEATVVGHFFCPGCTRT